MRDRSLNEKPEVAEIPKPKAFNITEIKDENKQKLYLEWARDQVQILSGNEFKNWMMEERGSFILGATAWFINSYDPNYKEVYFRSAVNEDHFVLEEGDYRDLIPYAIEHEIQESLEKILIKVGEKSPVNTHSVGMKKEYELAAVDGNHSRLYEYMKLLSPNRLHEFQEAYDAVKQMDLLS